MHIILYLSPDHPGLKKPEFPWPNKGAGPASRSPKLQVSAATTFNVTLDSVAVESPGVLSDPKLGGELVTSILGDQKFKRSRPGRRW